MLIVGLGNFGKEFVNTYHNVGFMTIDYLSNKLGFKQNKKNCDAKFSENVFCNKKLILAQPLTYMNLSGLAVSKLAKKFKISNDNILIIYDDIDLPVGKIRFRKNGSGGTHNGMKSVVENMGSDIARIRIGIGKDDKMDLANYVLSKISLKNKEEIMNSIKLVSKSIIDYIENGKAVILEDLNK